MVHIKLVVNLPFVPAQMSRSPLLQFGVLFVLACLSSASAQSCAPIQSDADMCQAFPSFTSQRVVALTRTFSEPQNLPSTTASEGFTTIKSAYCRTMFNVIAAHAQYNSNYGANELTARKAVSSPSNSSEPTTFFFNGDTTTPSCTYPISSITFAYADTKHRTVTFEVKSDQLFDGNNMDHDVEFEFNTATSVPHPYVRAFGQMGIQSFVMGGYKITVNQIEQLLPYVPNVDNGEHCARLQHHSFFVHVDSALHVEVVVQEINAFF